MEFQVPAGCHARARDGVQEIGDRATAGHLGVGVDVVPGGEDEGALVGPQLDGIGNRGLDRIIEDIIDPNRNVDRAFRTHVIQLHDGDVLSGLPRREEGELLILADSTGKEISVSKTQIKSRKESESSLMPENFSDVIAPADLQKLISFLLSQRGE